MTAATPVLRSAASVDAELLRRIAALSVRVRNAVDGARAGAHRSPHRGASIVFREHTEYRPGDDTRHLDWKASARRDRHVLKRFEQESALTAWLLVDASGSMDFAGAGPASAPAPTKFEYASTLALGAAHVLLGQRDNFSVLRGSTEIDNWLPPRGGPSQFEAALHLLGAPPLGAETTDLGAMVAGVVERAGRRSLVAVFSDLIGADESFFAALRRAKARGHELWVVHTLTTEEIELPFEGGARFTGLEGEPPIEVDADAVRRAYLAEIETWLAGLRTELAAIGAHYVLARTDSAPELVLGTLLGRTTT